MDVISSWRRQAIDNIIPGSGKCGPENQTGEKCQTVVWKVVQDREDHSARAIRAEICLVHRHQPCVHMKAKSKRPQEKYLGPMEEINLGKRENIYGGVGGEKGHLRGVRSTLQAVGWTFY